MPTLSTAEVDLLDPRTFAAGIPHETFDDFRRQGLVRATSASCGVDVWVASRHCDVNLISRDIDTFSSQSRGTNLLFPPEQLHETPALTHTDPPRHAFLRRVVQAWFTPRAVAALEDQIRGSVRTGLRAVVSAGGGDFAADVAGVVPEQTLGHLLGVPVEDRAQVAEWGQLTNAVEDPEFASVIADHDPFVELCAYAHQLAAARRRQPGDDLTSHLLSATVNGQRLDVREFEVMVALLVNAGTGTTKDAIASGLTLLLDNPDQVRQLRQQPALISTAVEEILRMTTPVLYFSRTAREDAVVAGASIAAGERVALYFAGANFDPAVFAEPRTFDVRRSPNRHLTFGGVGRHLCLGSHLARLELRVLLEELLPILARVELAGEPERLHSHINHGFKRLPITIGTV